MDAAYLSAVAALAGSTIGGLTSLTASWLTQSIQFRAKQRTSDRNKREELYRDFIREASRLYVDAFEHNSVEVTNFVDLYALVSRMRILSSPKIVEQADRVALEIIRTYQGPNKTFRDVGEMLDNDTMNPLKAFSNACREELRRHDSS